MSSQVTIYRLSMSACPVFSYRRTTTNTNHQSLHSEFALNDIQGGRRGGPCRPWLYIGWSVTAAVSSCQELMASTDGIWETTSLSFPARNRTNGFRKWFRRMHHYYTHDHHSTDCFFSLVLFCLHKNYYYYYCHSSKNVTTDWFTWAQQFHLTHSFVTALPMLQYCTSIFALGI